MGIRQQMRELHVLIRERQVTLETQKAAGLGFVSIEQALYMSKMERSLSEIVLQLLDHIDHA
ncbi:hypothetical protein [Paenibacillus sp. 1P03SA]|uniref:hypothetical protein n=1 Tax=Paenibacillus sp. 1P03SA TaxID=3132294 RepID=UPI0039A3B936